MNNVVYNDNKTETNSFNLPHMKGYYNTNMNYPSVGEDGHQQHHLQGGTVNPNQPQVHQINAQPQLAPLQSQQMPQLQLQLRVIPQQTHQQNQQPPQNLMMPPQQQIGQLNYSQTQQIHPNHYEPRFYQQLVIVPQQPIQQPYYEAYPVNNYLLFPPYQYNQQYKDVRQSIVPNTGVNSNTPGTNSTSGLPQQGHQIQISSSHDQQHQHHHQQQQHQHQQHQSSYSQEELAHVQQALNVLYPGFIERLRLLVPTPPLLKATVRPDLSYTINQKRAKRRSKFTKEQDDLIVSLKRKGKSWVEIAEMSKVGLYLAARNRYQVIVGQQGNNNLLLWLNEDKDILRLKLDNAEVEKWRFLAVELNKATGKEFSASECREAIRELFFKNPLDFSVNEATIQECEKESKITEKANEQETKNGSSQPYVNLLLENLGSSTSSDINSGRSAGNSGSKNEDGRNLEEGRDPRGKSSSGSGGGVIQTPMNHFKQTNSVYEQNVPYGYNDDYHSLRSSQEPIENYKLNQNNYY